VLVILAHLSYGDPSLPLGPVWRNGIVLIASAQDKSFKYKIHFRHSFFAPSPQGFACLNIDFSPFGARSDSGARSIIDGRGQPSLSSRRDTSDRSRFRNFGGPVCRRLHAGARHPACHCAASKPMRPTATLAEIECAPKPTICIAASIRARSGISTTHAAAPFWLPTLPISAIQERPCACSTTNTARPMAQDPDLSQTADIIGTRRNPRAICKTTGCTIVQQC